MNLVAWTEIESFHNIRKFVKSYSENLNGNSTVRYKCKVKLHGTNAGVQVHTDGTIVAQSRTTILTDGADNAGFAKWVKENEVAWKAVAPGYIYFGEWIGPGVQKGVACSEIPKRAFALFAARPLVDYAASDYKDVLVVEPEELAKLVGSVPDTHILPWHEDIQYYIDWSTTAEILQDRVDYINARVMKVEVNDPWVEETFGVKGTGEGLVFYPTSTEHLGHTNFTNLVFKAKGEKHKNIKSAAPAQVDASSAGNITQFVDMVLTDARLEQGAMAVQADLVVAQLTFDMKLIGKFLAWVVSDVQKETQDELEASGLEWKQVSKPVGDKARAWYLAKAKSL